VCVCVCVAICWWFSCSVLFMWHIVQ